MHDLLPYIAQKLKAGGIDNVELSFNGIQTKLPLVVLTEVTNSAAIVADRTEYFSRISVQLDVYAENKKTVRETAQKISEIMTASGFNRGAVFFMPENSLERQMMTFSCNADSKKRLYGGIYS